MINNLETKEILLEFLPSQLLTKDDKKIILLVFGSLGDLDSFEYVQTVLDKFSTNQFNSYEYFALGIGSLKAKQKFCSYTGFPIERLFIVNDNTLHRKLQLSEGLNLGIPKWINMLLMCAGISSHGTLKEVIRGYLGDKSAPSVFTKEQNIKFNSHFKFSSRLFDLVGHGYQRPFELATLRLLNMFHIIRNWYLYFPSLKYITQRGATFVLDNDNSLLYSFRATSLLLYSSKANDPLEFVNYLD
tara:strand:- start:1546 stop:2277 length:732 start_codon:yes stop_codon:yes gene_type:complete